MSSTTAVPAWKRLGLKVKETISHDPLALAPVVPIAAGGLKIEKRKSESQSIPEDQGSKPKKPPKRVKLPKAERRPPPEADQLTYLRQYHSDRANWKFSKQKQNWILKSLYVIPDEYWTALKVYAEGLQAGSRERVSNEARDVIKKWNDFMSESDGKKEESAENESTVKELSDEKPVEDKSEASKENVKTDELKANTLKNTPPTEAKARRAQELVKLLEGEYIRLELLDDAEKQEGTRQIEGREKTSKIEDEDEQNISEQADETEKKHKHRKKSEKSSQSKQEKKEKRVKKDKKSKQNESG